MAEDDFEGAGKRKLLIRLSVVVPVLLVCGGIAAYFGMDWYNERNTIRPVDLNKLVVKPKASDGPQGNKPPPSKVEPRKGFVSPDAVLDAYVQALRDGNVAACKATMTTERLMHDNDYHSEIFARPIDPMQLDKKWLDVMKYYNGAEWRTAEFKRFAVEMEGDAKAIIVCVFQNNGKGKKDRYRRYVFVKDDGGWLQSDWKDGDAKELDAVKYGYKWE